MCVGVCIVYWDRYMIGGVCGCVLLGKVMGRVIVCMWVRRGEGRGRFVYVV